MGEPHSYSHSTPLVNRFTMCEDSGYLTNTPESTDSMRSMSRFSLASSGNRSAQQQDSLFPAVDDGMLYTPEPVGSKAVRRVSLNCNKPFPMSAEESHAINPFTEAIFEWGGRDGYLEGDNMYVDEEVEEMRVGPGDYSREAEVYVPDPLDASLYEPVQRKQLPEVSKQVGMEIDDDIPQLHPNSENEEWAEQGDYNRQLLEEKMSQRKSLSFETLSGQQLLLEKLEHVKTDRKESPGCCTWANGWRNQLRMKGHRYALDFSGKNTVDFLMCLGVHSSHQPVVSRILGHLSPADLEACVNVSKAWRDICSQDRHATARLQRHARQRATLKENHVKRSYAGQSRKLGPLAAIGNLRDAVGPPPRSPSVSPTKMRFEECAALERTGATVSLCPRCRGPARVDASVLEAVCHRLGCNYVFCTTCRLQSHRPRSCLYATGRRAPKRGAIGSKESRRNLRRLLDG